MWHILAAAAALVGIVFDVIALGGLAETTKQCRDALDDDDQCGEIYGLEWFIIVTLAVYFVLACLLSILGKVRGIRAKVFVCASLAMLWPFVVRFTDKYIVVGDTSKDEIGASAAGHTVMAITIPITIALTALAHEDPASKSANNA